MNIENQIQQLAAEYHKLIGGDHHKDRDCHWHIDVTWSYGASARYFVRHKGYVYDNVEILCGCYVEALDKLHEELKRAIELEKIRAEQDEGINFPDGLPSGSKTGFEL
jgi:hypothetical protein